MSIVDEPELQVSPRMFNRIEIGAVRREKKQKNVVFSGNPVELLFFVERSIVHYYKRKSWNSSKQFPLEPVVEKIRFCRVGVALYSHVSFTV